MGLGSSRLGLVLAYAAALAAFGCTPRGCPEGSEEVDGLCLAVDAGHGEDPIGAGGSGDTGGVDGSVGDAGVHDIDGECTSSANPCDTDPPACVSFEPAEGSFQCECPEGYTGNGRGEKGCQDIDECATDNGGCDVLATCTNHEGAPPSCGPCPEGYTGDGEQGCEPRLLGLDISSGTLTPAFDPEVHDYYVKVPVVVQTATITAVLPAGAELTVNNEVVESGEASQPVALNLGDNTIEIRVNRDGHTSRTYTLRITRGELGAYLKASNTDADDLFGVSVSLWGETLAVGTEGEDSAARGINGDQADNSATNAGAVYIFQRSGDSWDQQAYLKASNTDGTDFFGDSVSLSSGTLAVGASWEDSAASGVGGNQADNSASSAGAVYIFQPNGDTWAQQAYLKASNTDESDLFGGSVSLAGDILAVGARNEASAATGVSGDQADDNTSGAGAVYLY